MKFLLIAAKQRSKNKNIQFNLTEKDLNIPDTCPVFGIPLTSPSLDRINPKEGYVKGNVRVISKRANRLKSDMTFEECQMLLKDFECQRLLNNT